MINATEKQKPGKESERDWGLGNEPFYIGGQGRFHGKDSLEQTERFKPVKNPFRKHFDFMSFLL